MAPRSALGRYRFNSLRPTLSRREQAGKPSENHRSHASCEAMLSVIVSGTRTSSVPAIADGVTRLTSDYRTCLVDPWLRLQLPRAGERAPGGWSPSYTSRVHVLGSEVGLPVSAGWRPRCEVQSPRSEVRLPGSRF